MPLICLLASMTAAGDFVSERKFRLTELKDSEQAKWDIPEPAEPVKIRGISASFVVIEDLDGAHFFALRLTNSSAQEVVLPLSEVYRHSNIEVIVSGGKLLVPVRETPVELVVPPKLKLEPGLEKYMRIDFEEYSYFNDLVKGGHKTFMMRHLAFAGNRQMFRLEEIVK